MIKVTRDLRDRVIVVIKKIATTAIERAMTIVIKGIVEATTKGMMIKGVKDPDLFTLRKGSVIGETVLVGILDVGDIVRLLNIRRM